MKRIKIGILVSIALIGGLVSVLLWVNLRDKGSSPAEEKVFKISTEGADVRLEKIRFIEDKHGQKTWELEARAIQQYQEQSVMVLEDVKVTVHTKDGKSFVISGDRGKVFQETKDLELTGNVLVASDDGIRLKTNSVSYRHSEKRVSTSDPVEIEGDQIQVVGKGLLVDIEGKTFKILGGVRTQLKARGKG
jgi:LPS export ABC transporter protein LptC